MCSAAIVCFHKNMAALPARKLGKFTRSIIVSRALNCMVKNTAEV